MNKDGRVVSFPVGEISLRETGHKRDVGPGEMGPQDLLRLVNANFLAGPLALKDRFREKTTQQDYGDADK